MTKRIGSTENLIDWSSLLTSITPRTGDHNTVTSVVDRSEVEAKNDSTLLNSYREIINTWKDAGYKLNNIEWWDYYPGEHFDISVQDKFAKLVNAEPRRVFISEVMPGRCVPYHWDVEDHEDEWIANGDRLVRYVCFIDKPTVAQSLILKDECFHLVPQHEVYRWDHYRDYHAGTNAGVGPYYLCHFVGAQQ